VKNEDLTPMSSLCLRLDLKIIGLTAWKILKREGINKPGQATSEEFKGKEGV